MSEGLTNGRARCNGTITKTPPRRSRAVAKAAGRRSESDIRKDKGDFSKSAAGLRHYSDTIIISGPRNEGWATGDYAQVLMEMEQIDHVERKFLALLKERPTYFSPDEKNRDRGNNDIFIRRCLVRRMTLSASALFRS
jgi:hypothetical protein